MFDKLATSRRRVLGSGALAIAAGMLGVPPAALAQKAAASGPRRKFIWVPQALGDWDTAMRVGHKDFCDLAGWDYQRIGNPNYSVENHVEQVNNAIAAKADVIATSLESVGLVSVFERGLSQGVTMVITDQGIEDEARKLGLNIINQDEWNCGLLNGAQAASFAEKLTGKKDGVIVLGNGNPGSTSIDKRQNGTAAAIAQYNKEHGTNYRFEAFPDGEFGELTESIQKWTSQFDEKGDELVGAVGTGNPMPIVQAMQEHGIKPGSIAAGSPDSPPAQQKAISEGWLQWGIDQQFYLMGYMTAASSWGQLEGAYPYPNVHTGGKVVTKENLAQVGNQTQVWLKKAKTYGFA